MIGELVFTRAGVHVRAGSAHAVPGIDDRSTLHWEYWRRNRTTSDGSFWWGHNSQWKTGLHRDYITGRGHVYDFDALSSFMKTDASSALTTSPTSTTRTTASTSAATGPPRLAVRIMPA